MIIIHLAKLKRNIVMRKKKKITLLTFFMYIVLNILTLTAEEWNFRDKGMAQRTKRSSRLVPL